jgi:K+-dependent Na+/Ca+ exchanger-like protein
MLAVTALRWCAVPVLLYPFLVWRPSEVAVAPANHAVDLHVEAVPTPDAEQAAGMSLSALPTDPAAYWWWVLILYMFYCMAAICDEYLVPAVDKICERFHIPEDVAGATLVAFACNGPELLTNVCAIFLTKSSVGMGTIVGSAIFNVLCITAACPLASPSGSLTVPKVSFLRDAFFSLVSILILLWALPVIDMLRASVLFGMAFVYTLCVAKTKDWFGEDEKKDDDDYHAVAPAHDFHHPDHHPLTSPPADFGRRTGRLSLVSKDLKSLVGEPSMQHSKRKSLVAMNISPGGYAALPEEPAGNAEDDATFSERMGVPVFDGTESAMGKFFAWLCFVLCVPTSFILYLLIPDVRTSSDKDKYFLSFVLSMIMLSATAFVVCIGSDKLHAFWGIPQSFLGLTLVSVGTSFPNLWASVVTARVGRGAIAVSNALGSNVQNVFLVLAGPIWVKVLLAGSYNTGNGAILVSVIWMAVTLGIVVVLTAASGFVMTKGAAVFMVCVYCVYLVNAVIVAE